MLLDKGNEFGDAFDITEVTGTYLFTNQIDLGIAGRDPGNGQPIYLVIVVLTAIVGASSTTQFRLASDSTAAIHATSSTEHYLSEAFTPAMLTQGAKPVIVGLPIEGLTYERYLGLQVIIGGATITAGEISAFLTIDPTGWKSYADANN